LHAHFEIRHITLQLDTSACAQWLEGEAFCRWFRGAPMLFCTAGLQFVANPLRHGGLRPKVGPIQQE